MSMKKTVLTWGLIAGGVTSLMMLIALPFADQIGFEKGAILGYTGLVASSILIYFGVRSYRDNVAGGRITFGQGFKVGILIALVASLLYVVTWQVVYFGFQPDFCDKYAAHAIAKAKASGASPEKIAEIEGQMATMKKWMDNPLTNAAMTMIEPFPFGLVAALVSAGILKRKQE
jgi:hypothetical protein